MRRVVTEHLTLDGVMQARARPTRTPAAASPHGGWAMPNNDEVMAKCWEKGWPGRAAAVRPRLVRRLGRGGDRPVGCH
jgi:hypothetical protein